MITPVTPLQKHVARWLKSTGKEYSNGPAGAYDDLMTGGCASGMVGRLVYYTDTLRFYRRYRDEIDALLSRTLDDFGYTSPAELFSEAKWDRSDPLAHDTQNQNLLAWFGFEETARFLME